MLLKEKLKDSNGVIRDRKSTHRQHNGQTKTQKRKNNSLQIITQKDKQCENVLDV